MPVGQPAVAPLDGALPFDPVAARAEHFAPGAERVLSKKEEWLREKSLRPDFHLSDGDLARALRRAPPRRRTPTAGADPFWPGERVEPVTTLFNVWTHEALPIMPGQAPG